MVVNATVNINEVSEEILAEVLKYGETLEIIDNDIRHIWIKDHEKSKQKLNQMVERSIINLRQELRPTKLGEMLKIEHPILKLITISRYEGYGIALKELGANITNLETLIETEANKTEPYIKELFCLH